MFITEAASVPALQTAGNALPGNGDGFPRIGLDLAVSMFAPCLLGCRDTPLCQARQRPVPGGSRSRGLPHGPAGSSITRHQEVLSKTLSSGLLISGFISPVAGLYGNRAAISLTAATNGHLGLVIQPVTGTAIRGVHDRCITGPRQVHDRLCWIQSQRAAGTRPPPPWQPRREGAGRSGSLPRPQVRTRPSRRPAGAARRRNRRPECTACTSQASSPDARVTGQNGRGSAKQAVPRTAPSARTLSAYLHRHVTASGFGDGPFSVLGRVSVCSLALIAAGSCERAAGSGGAERPA